MKAALLLCTLAAATPASAETLAIVHAEAWTMEKPAPVHDATILIDGNRIVSVRAAGAVPPNIRTIDATGHAVTPGLVNAATQIGLVEVSSAADTRDATSQGDLGADFDVARALSGNSALVELARSDGMTGALSYPSPSGVAPFAGQAALIRLRDGVDILDRAGAALFVQIGGGAWDKVGSRAAQWQLLRTALDTAKQPGGKAPASLRAMLAGTMPLAIDTNRESDIRQAIALAGDYAIRIVIIGGAQAWRAADALAAAHIPVVVDPQANLPGTFDELGSRQDNAAILARAGVTIALGQVGGKMAQTYNSGLALREGAGIAVANGLPYLEALRAITGNARAIWGRDGGTLVAGADADLVVWDGDPLEPSSNATAVIIEGRSVSTHSRQDALAERYRDPRP